jgi:protein-serine/threonine kinase
VVHRQPTKPRVNVLSIEKSVVEIVPQSSPPGTSSGETSANSGKSSAPGGSSTGKTSLDSKFSSPVKVVSGDSSESKRAQCCPKPVGPEGSCELPPIWETVIDAAPDPVPSKSSPIRQLREFV